MSKKEIVVGQRGWVFLGDVRQEDDSLVIENGFCVRRWGTTRGLGQLATEGKQPDTVLDPIPTTRIHELAVVCRHECGEVWEK